MHICSILINDKPDSSKLEDKMLIAKSSIRIKIDINSLWNIFTDYQNWPKWDPSITKAWLENGSEFELNAKGSIQRLSGRIANFEVIEYTEPYSYVTKTNLPLFCTLLYRHQVELDPLDIEYCIVTDLVYLEGIFAFFFKLYFGGQLQKDTDIALIKMKLLYEIIKEEV